MGKFNGSLKLALLVLASKDLMFAKISTLSMLRFNGSLKLLLLSSQDFIIRISILRINNILKLALLARPDLMVH
jgi:hypothetical protein